MSRRRRYGYARSDPLRDLIASALGLIIFFCILAVFSWVMSQPGAFAFNFEKPTPSPAQGTTFQTSLLGSILVIIIPIALIGLSVLGLLWWSKEKRQTVKGIQATTDPITTATMLEPNQTTQTPRLNTIAVPEASSTSETSASRLSVMPNSPMTNAERAFFTFLQNAVKDSYHIFPQMPLDRLVKKKGMLPVEYYTMLENGSVDFVLAHPKYLNSVLAIELDDSSHSQSVNKQRDQVKEALLKETGLPLIRFRVGDNWDSRQIRQKIDEAIGRSKE